MKNINCLRCENEMKYLKEYKFDSQDANRGLFSTLFDVEEHLLLDLYVCPNCRHVEFFYTGSSTRID